MFSMWVTLFVFSSICEGEFKTIRSDVTSLTSFLFSLTLLLHDDWFDMNDIYISYYSGLISLAHT